MAGNIPPLVSTTPPPLTAFDDDDEEEEDEFGLYNVAEEFDYTDCISFREKDEGKPNAGKTRGEQDSTSQDSATDSGLCPDSEGMSPTPHSDDERTLKQNLCDKLCQKPGGQSQSCGSELGAFQGSPSVNLETNPCPNLPNGHCGQENDDDFGNFEFAPSHNIQDVEEECFGEVVLRSKSPLNIGQHTEEESKGDCVSNSHLHNEQFTEENEEIKTELPELKLSESKLSGLDIDESECTSAKYENCICEQSNIQLDESTVGKLDITSSNGSSSFNSIDFNLEPKDPTFSGSESQQVEQDDLDNMEKPVKDYEVDSKSTTENLDHREEKENKVLVEKDGDDEFDDFTEFKADFSGCHDSSKSEQGDMFSEHSKTFVAQTKVEEATSLPASHQEESDEEFSNFADFSSSDCAFLSAQSSNSLENVSHIPLKLDDSDLRTECEFQDWGSVFPCEDGESSLVVSTLLRQDDIVWSRLFPLESSPALSYQWNESLANRRLLSALNIDSRNILFTPWSTSAVPRFAANLSCGPLEPIKATEPLQPSVTPPSIVTTITTAPATTTITTTAAATTTNSSTQESVPDAHFDWVSSGLTNPLDCPKTLLNLPKTLSADAENILSSLPDISFMKKTYIDFPINEA